MKKLLTLLLALAMLLSMAAVAEAPDTSVESTDAAAAELGIPAAVTLHDTDALSGNRGEPTKYETVEKIQAGLENVCSQIYDGIFTLS